MKRNATIYLTQGRHQGVHTWHYVKVDPIKLPIFRQALKSGTLDVAEYGEVLFSGYGKEPPSEITQKIKETYH